MAFGDKYAKYKAENKKIDVKLPPQTRSYNIGASKGMQSVAKRSLDRVIPPEPPAPPETPDIPSASAARSSYMQPLAAYDAAKTPLGGSPYAPGAIMRQEAELERTRRIAQEATARENAVRLASAVERARSAPAVDPDSVKKQNTTFKNVNRKEPPTAVIGIGVKTSEQIARENPLSYLLPEERKIYNNIYANDGADLAQDYIDSLADTLNRRTGTMIAREFEGKPVQSIGFGLKAGLSRGEQGLANAFLENPMPTSQFAYAGQRVRENLGDVGPKILGQSLGQAAYDIAENTANMAPSLAVSALTGSPALAAATMGVSSAGNAYQEKVNAGYSKEQARMYSTIIGAAEGGLQYVLGGIGALGGKLSGGAVSKAMSAVDNAAAKFALQFGGSFASEGLEEGLQEAIEPVVAAAALGDKYTPAQLEQIAYAALLGGLTGGMFKGAEIAGEVSSTRSAGKSVRDTASAVIEEGLASDKTSEAYRNDERLKKIMDSGKRISDYELGRQYSLNLSQMNTETSVGQQETQQDDSEGVDTADETISAESPVNAVDSAVENYRRNGTVTNSEANRILNDPSAMAELGIDLSGMTSSQKRAAIKSEIASIASQRAAETTQEANDGTDTTFTENAVESDTEPYTETVNTDSGLDLPKVDAPAGLVRDSDLSSAKFDQQTINRMDGIGKALGVSVKVLPTISAGKSGANGVYANGTIYVAADATDPVNTVVIHETVHAIKQSSPDAYSALESFVRDNLDSEIFKGYGDVLRERGYHGTESDIAEETVADAFGYVLTDSKVLDRFVETSDRGTIQKILDAIREVISKIKNAISGKNTGLSEEQRSIFSDLVDRLESAEQLFYDAVQEASEASVSTGGNKKFSLKTPVEEANNLIALHNLTEEKLLKTLDLGGFPMPSIAITKSDIPHTNFGDITLVMDKRSIDPKVSRKNVVYSADAWTPTFPQIEYEADPVVSKRIYNRLNSLSKRIDDVFKNDLFQVSSDMNGLLNRYGGEDGLIQNVTDNYGLKAAYLEEQGKHIAAETTQREVEKKYNPDRADKYNAIVEVLGISEPDAIGRIPLKDLRDQYGDALERAFPGVTKSAFRLRSVIGQVMAYLEDRGGTPSYETVTDMASTRKTIDSLLDVDEYRAWVRNLFFGVEGSSGIYNNKDPFTPSGNRRTFQQTHYPVTLENIVKAMKGQNDGNAKNVSGFFGVKSLRAGLAERFKSIEDMHKLEGRLQNLSEDDVNAINNALDQRLIDISQEISEKSPGSYGDFDSIGSIMVEVADGGNYTVDGIVQKFNDEYGYNISDALAAKVRDLLFDVSQMPVNIFEAKPQRVVGFDEILVAVVPDSSGTELISRLDDAGVNTITYKSGDVSDRLEKVNSVDNARFSLKSGSETKELASLARELSATKEKLEYWKNQTKRTKKVTTDKKSVVDAAKSIVKETESDIDVNEVAKDLQAMYDKMSGTDVIYEDIREDANRIADKIIENASVTDRTVYDDTKEMRSFISSQTFYINEYDKSNIPDFSDWKKNNRVITVKNGQTNIDQIYDELSGLYPEYFDDSVVSPADQLQRIADVYRDTKNIVEYNPFDSDIRGAKVWLSNELIDRFFDLPQTAPTFADIAQRRLDDANQKLREAERRHKEEMRASKKLAGKEKSDLLKKSRQDLAKAKREATLAGMMAQGRKDAKAAREAADRYALKLEGVKQRYEKKLADTKEKYKAKYSETASVPKEPRRRTEDGRVERGFSRNIRTDKARVQAIRDSFDKNPEFYEVLSNKTTTQKALDILDEGFSVARTKLEQAIGAAKEGKKLSPEMVPLAKMIADQLTVDGEIEAAREILADVGAELTSYGQITQAGAILRDSDHSGRVRFVEKIAKKVEDASQKTGPKRIRKEDSEGVANELKHHRKKAARDVSDAVDEFADAVDNSGESGSPIKKVRKAMGKKGKPSFQDTLGNIPENGSLDEYFKAIDDAISENDHNRWVYKLAVDLAKRAEKLADNKDKSQTTYEIMIDDLGSFMRQYVKPGKNSTKTRTASDTLADYFSNRENYAIAWNRAREQLKQKYADNKEMADRLEDFIQGTMSYNATGTDAVILRAITSIAVDRNFRLKEYVIRNQYDKDSIVSSIADELISKTGASGADAQIITDAVSRYVDEKAHPTIRVPSVYFREDIPKALKAIGLKMSDILTKGASDKAAVAKQVSDFLIKEYGISKKGAEAISIDLTDQFNRMVRERSQKRLEMMFKNATKPVQKTFEQRFDELINLGAFSSGFNSSAVNRLFGATGIIVDNDLIERYANAKTDKEKNDALDAIYQNISDQVPTSAMDVFTAVRYTNMLGNLKTQVRNVTGNAFMRIAASTKTHTQAIIEDIVSRQTKGKLEKSTTFFRDKELYKAAKEDFDLFKSEVMGEQKYRGGKSGIPKSVQDKRTIFKIDGSWGKKEGSPSAAKAARKAADKVLSGYELYRKVTNEAMERGDIMFSKPAYADSLSRYLKAKGYSSEQFIRKEIPKDVLDSAREKAIRYAQEQTFRDHNAFSDMVSSIGFKDTTGNNFKKLANILLSGIQPFMRTPANVAVRAVEYSPIEIVDVAVKTAKKIKGSDDVTGNDIIESLAKFLTGSGIFAIGMAMSNLGLLSGGDGDDEKQSDMDKLTGKQSYAITLPNGDSYTLDWAAPVAMPLFMGAEFMESFSENGLNMEDALKAAGGMSNVLLNMSMMQGLNQQLSDISYSEVPLVDLSVNALVSYLSQGLTNTLLGQMERSTEDKRYTTFVDKNSKVPPDIQYTLGKTSAKTPGWDFQQIPFIDAWGREDESEPFAERVFNQIINPAYTSKTNETPLDKEILRIYDQIGEYGAKAIPSRAEKEVTSDGETVYLTSDQYLKYAKGKGQMSFNLGSDAIKRSSYKSLTDEQKANVLQDIYSYADAISRNELGLYDLPEWMNEIRENNIDPVGVIIYREIESSLKQSGIESAKAKADAVETLSNDNLLTDKQKEDILLSNMSDSGAEKWERAKKLGMSISEYATYYPIVSASGKKKEEIISDLLDAGMSRNDAYRFWNTIKSKDYNLKLN